MANELNLSIGAEIDGLQKGLDQAGKELTKFEGKVKNLAKVGDQMQSIGKKMTIGISLPLIGLGAAAVKSFGDIQALKFGLEAVLGSASAANAEFKKLKVVSQLPGLGMEEAIKGSINLQSIGMSADKSRKILSEFGNAVATVGKGRAEFERAIYGVQQLANTDFPLGEDLNIIKDALPQVTTLLKEAFGASRSDELAKMGVSSKEIMDVILEGLGKLPRVTGGINGAFENMADGIKTSLSRIGKIIDEKLDIASIVDKIVGSIDKLVTGFENLSPAMQNFILIGSGIAIVIGPIIIALGTVLTLLPIFMTGVTSITTALAGLSAVIFAIPIIELAAAIVLITGAIYSYTRAASEAKQVEERLNSVRETAAKNIAGERAEMDSLLKVAKDETKSKEDRQSAIDEINKIYPDYIENITLDTINTDKGTEANKEYIKSINARALSMAAMAEKTKLYQEKIKKSQEKLTASPFSTDEFWSLFGVKTENIKGIDDYNAKLKEMRESSKYSEEGINAFVQAYKPLIDARKKDIGNIDAQISALDEYIVVAEKAKDVVVSDPIVPPTLGDGTGGIPKVDPLKIGFEPIWEEDIITFGATEEDIKKHFAGIKQTYFTEGEIAAAEMKITNEKIDEAVSGIISQGAIDSISDASAAIGNALANGNNVLQAVGKSLLSSLGGILVDLGKMSIEIGVGLIAVELGLKSLNPAVAIAAGVALVALGSFFSSKSKSIGNSMGGGGGSSSTGSAGGGSYSTPTSNTQSSGGFGGGTVVFEIEGQKLVGVLSRTLDRNQRLASDIGL